MSSQLCGSSLLSSQPNYNQLSIYLPFPLPLSVRFDLGVIDQIGTGVDRSAGVSFPSLFTHAQNLSKKALQLMI